MTFDFAGRTDASVGARTRVETLLDRLDRLDVLWGGDQACVRYWMEPSPGGRRFETASERPEETLILAELSELFGRENFNVASVEALLAERRASRASATPEPRSSGYANLLRKFGDALERDYLNAEAVIADDPDRGLISIEELNLEKARFVYRWAKRALGLELDREQAIAVATVHGNVQVTARAGSGKTRVLVTRAIFLQQVCGVSPRHILLLAFNRTAAAEIRGRLAETLGKEVPHVMTFHALAHAVAHPEESILFDNEEASQLKLSEAIQAVIDEHIQSPEHMPAIQKMMLDHFREDWERVIAGGFQLPAAEFLALRRGATRQSLDGTPVKSRGEKIIANALFEHAIDYRYEPRHTWSGVNYRPDFTVGNIVIEFFGLKGDLDYDEMSAAKRNFWRTREEWTLIDLTPDDLDRDGPEGFVERLLTRLRELGVKTRKRSDDEIWDEVHTRAIDEFTKAVRTFVGRCRTLGLDEQGVADLVSRHVPASAAEDQFLNIASLIYGGYLARLQNAGELDFSGLSWRAAAMITEGSTTFVRDRGRERGDVAQLQHVMVDEFQDFSEMFFGLLAAVRSVNPSAQFFGVGDDWQAINGFAGSDLRFFHDYAKYFPRPSQVTLRTNYRSTTSVVAASNALMNGYGPAGVAKATQRGDVAIHDLSEFQLTGAEADRHGDEITPAVLRLLKRYLDRGNRVVILSRSNGVPWYVDYGRASARATNDLDRFLAHLRTFLPADDRKHVTISTAHRYKGLEKPAVIVFDAVIHRYPLIHPSWIYSRVFGDTPTLLEDSERRLLYVAITRAEDSLALITERGRESAFLSLVANGQPTTPWPNTAYPSLGGPRLEIRVSNVFDAGDIKDRLRSLGYKPVWQPTFFWRRTVPREGFDFDALLRQEWLRPPVKIQVVDESDQVVHTT